MFCLNKLKAQMVLKEISAKDLAKALDLNEATFYRKLKNDGSFTRGELEVIIQTLDIEDPADIFFAKELA